MEAQDVTPGPIEIPSRRRCAWLLTLLLGLLPATASAQEPAAETPLELPAPLELEEEEPAPLPPPAPEAPVATPEPLPGDEAPLLTPGRGTGPGLPWQVVLVVQLVAYMLADALPYLGCVVGSWIVSLTVPLGPALLMGLLLSAALIPVAALTSGCASAALLQWLGDRLGTKRGRLFFVGLASVTLSLVTYTLVIAPIILGMGFFAAAAASFLSAYFVLPRVQLELENVPPWLVPLVTYSVPAVGAVLAVAVLAVGAVLAPLTGFIIRPALVALTYSLTGRDREAGEEQWPPSLFGERLESWPRPPWARRPAPVPPAPSAPKPAPAPAVPPGKSAAQSGVAY